MVVLIDSPWQTNTIQYKLQSYLRTIYIYVQGDFKHNAEILPPKGHHDKSFEGY